MQWKARYERHYSLPGFGHLAQEKLAAAKVLVIGAGGLGCPVLQYLTAGGVGCIGIVDFDTIQLSNLQRQTLYRTDHVGLLKCQVAAQQLRAINPDVEIIEHPVQLDQNQADLIIQHYDIIVDCTDNFAVRYVINDCCAILQKPLVFAAIYQYEGQIAIFNVENDQGMACNYRDLFPVVPTAEEAPNCMENGVLGVLPGIIGLMQATEVIKLITGIGEPLINKLMTFNVLNYQSMIVEITADAPVQVENMDITALEMKEHVDHARLLEEDISGIQPHEIEVYRSDSDVSIIDIRESDEEPAFPMADQGIPLSVLYARMDEIRASHIIVVCQSGKRSIHAAQQLKMHFGNTRRISHLIGGIMRYLNNNKPE
ncbi:hypothetical protein GEO21_11985 [Sphingobacterium faecium]|uniref:HesA/MoeB/ThiF family protein n=1 Tax=Sphingobacterium faecium TaxID=34087 RepID=UPI001290F54B|nr:HesA/MoeB/ThiF family protein [Sphingobacterium faecium]MQP28226.1 hypothetical protein [Sphingobacterium faecium]